MRPKRSLSIVVIAGLASTVAMTFPAAGQTMGTTFRLTLPPIPTPGSSVDVIHSADDTTGVGYTGYQLAACYDPAILAPAGVEEGADLIAAAGGAVFFFSPAIRADSVGVSVILSGVGATTIPSGAGQVLTTLGFTVLGGTLGSPAPVAFCDFVVPGPPDAPYENILLVGGRIVEPELAYGDALPHGALLIRGDVDGNGDLDLADPIRILDVIFQSGAAVPCLDAMDANDDGVVDIADAVAILEHLFASGAPPSAPFPACGFDPSPDPLPCPSPASGC